MSDTPVPSQRLDKWLWCARFFKSRSQAARLLGAGKLRLSGRIVSKAHQLVRPGDVLTFPQGPNIRVVRVSCLAARRGPSPEARTLYEDLAPIEQQGRTGENFAARDSRAPRRGGRPTKEDRRAVDRLMGRQ